MLRNVKDAWWRSMVQQRDDVVGIDAAVLSPPRVWEASGHLANFTDPLVDCRSCHERWRADKIEGVCPNCGSKDLTAARQFNLMFSTHVGPVADEGSIAYLRPETAQGMFTNFANVVTTTRKKPPFGIAQIGKAFRNEITPQNFVFRTREFDVMEMEYFVPPAEAPKVVRVLARAAPRLVLGSRHARRHAADPPPRAEELSHYSAGTADLEFSFPWGWGELEGIANRTDYDLRVHSEASGEQLEYFDQATERALLPLRDRTGARRDPGDDGLSHRRLRRGRGRRRGAHGPAPRPPARPLPGGGAPAVQEGHPRAARPRACSRCSSHSSSATTTPRSRSAGATAARTRWAPRGA